MKQIKIFIIVLLAIVTLSSLGVSHAKAQSSGNIGCQPQFSFFGLVPWYAYFPAEDFKSVPVYNSSTGKTENVCGFHKSFLTTTNNGNTTTGINGSSLDTFWLIALAVLEDLLRIAGFLAVGVVIYGGIRYMTSAGDPSTAKAAQQTILNAVIGMAIAIIAATTVSFLGNKLGG